MSPDKAKALPWVPWGSELQFSGLSTGGRKPGLTKL
jgi:hypothetical protein